MAVSSARAATAQQNLLTAQQRTATATNQTATAAQRLATEEQRTATTAQRLATEEQRTAAAAATAAKAQSQAELAALRLAKAQEQAANSSQRGATFAQQLGQAYTSSLQSIIGPAAIAAASLKAVSEAGELIQLGAQAEQTRQRIEALAVSAHTTGDALLSAMRSASAGTISDLNLQLAANRAQLLGVANSAQQFSTLMQIARARAQDMGISTTQAFNDLVTGLGRGSALILDNLGITVSVTEANKVYAQQLGKNASALTEQEQKQALINAVLAQGKASLDATGGAAETNASKLERLAAMWENLKASVGGGLANAVLPTVDAVTTLGATTDGTRESILRYVDAANTYNNANAGVAEMNRNAAAAILDFLGVAGGQATAVEANAVAMNAAAAAVTQLIPPTEQATQAQLAQASSMELAGIQARAAAMAAEQKSTADQVAAIDAQTHAVADQALAEQAQAAAQALLAAGPAGASTAAILAQSSSRVDVLTAAYYRLFAAMAQVGAAKTNAQALSDQRAGERSGGTVRSQAEERAQADRLATIQRNQARTAQEQLQADLAIARAKGDQAAQVRLLRQEQAGLTAGSARYKEIEAQIISAEKGRGGGGGRGGASAADKSAKAAAATASRLEDIQRSSGNKLADIEENTQSKLAAIDAKYAAQRLRDIQELNNEIAESSASVRYDQTLDNFDAFQKDMSKEQQAAFKAREAAEAHYNERVAAAQEQARQEAQTGDAQLAQDKLKIRTEEAKKQQEIEERAAKANADTGGKQKEQVAATAKAASDAAKAQADTEIAIAEAKAAERAGAEQAEKDAVIAQAEEQKAKVIEAATEQANKVKGASDSQKQAVISDLQAQASAAKTWADTVVEQAGRVQDAYAGASGPPTTGGGAGTGGDTGEGGGADTGSGGAGGPGIQGIGMGGPNHVGGSGGSGGDILQTLQQTISFLDQLLPLITHHNEMVKQLRTYEHTVTDTVKVLAQVEDLHKSLAQPLPPLPASIFDQMASEITLMLTTLATKIDPNLAKYQRTFEHILGADRAAVAVFTEIVNLRKSLGTPPPPLLLTHVQTLADEAQAIVNLLESRVVGANQRQEDDLKRYAEMVSASTGIVQEIADLRRGLSEAIPPLDLGWVNALATDAQRIVRIVQTLVLPFAEQALKDLQAYADAVSASTGVLKDVADLRKSLAEGIGPDLTYQVITRLASDAQIITRVVQELLIPETEEQAAALTRYTDAAGAAIGILKDVADLRRGLAEGMGPDFYLQQIERLASDALIITRVVESLIEPTTEQQVSVLSAYADAAGRAIGILKDAADLRKDAADLAGPLPIGQIAKLADEAQQVARIVIARLLPISDDQAKAMERYGQTAGAAVDAVKNVADLRQEAADIGPPLTVAQITALADEAKRITQIVVGRMVPLSEDQAKAARQFADTEGAAVAALKSVLDLPAKLFADYQSPSNAQIDRVANDANRIILRVSQAARAYDTKGLEAAKAFGDATSSVIGAFKDELLFAQALASGDFVLDPKNLAKFETGMGQTLDTARRLGARASAIPSADIAALQSAAEALDTSYSSMIKLAAVPFGNLPQIAAGFGAAVGAGGGGGGTTINVNIYNPPANLNVPGLIDQVKRGVTQSLGAKR